MAGCAHTQVVTDVNTGTTVCEECIETGGSWVHLRTCQECGITLCCDSSPSKHARAHFESHGHPVIASAERGERWMWCYVDEKYTKY